MPSFDHHPNSNVNAAYVFRLTWSCLNVVEAVDESLWRRWRIGSDEEAALLLLAAAAAGDPCSLRC